MEYALLIYETEDDVTLRGKEDHTHAYLSYMDALKAAGVFAGASYLQPAFTATSVQVESGKRHVQDGPVSASKEQLGGVMLINVPDLDAALDWAARCPGSRCRVEIRPLVPSDGD
ncbi:MAG: YciI family protein [Myxococcota bacterium]